MIFHFGHLKNVVRDFQKINDTVKYELQNWIISHTHLITSTIEDDYITVKFYDGIRGVKTE